MPGQPVSFTVDAFPGETFKGEVGKVRLNATMTQNVVTYTVEIITDNSSGRLLPYLTANVQFELDRRNNVLMVPNAALRWTPSAEQIAPQIRDAGGCAGRRREATRRYESAIRQSAIRNRAVRNPDRRPASGTTRGTLWVLDGKYVRPVPVQVGPTDGAMTEVQGQGLTEGLEIVMGVQAKATAQSGLHQPVRAAVPARRPTRRRCRWRWRSARRGRPRRPAVTVTSCFAWSKQTHGTHRIA